MLREGQHAGLLIHGMGRLGKSSLAARIAHRRPDLTPVVVFERYDALTIADDLALAVPEAAAAIEGERARLFDQPEALEGLLRRLLEGPCQQKATGKPILLVIDDLERLLDEPADGAGLWRAKEAHRKMLRAVLRAFAHANTHSRLMLTSRYRFTLPDGADDLAARLHPLHLAPMDEAGARKQGLRRLEAEPAASEAEEGTRRNELAPRAIAAARGSPGLLDLLFDLIEADADEAVRALDDMQRYLDEGTEPSEPKVLAFLQDLLLGRLLELAGPGGEALLRAAMIFALPVPATAVRSLAAADGGDVERLQALRLLDAYEDLADPASAALAVNPLVRPKLAPSSEEEAAAAYARSAVEPLFRAWGGEDGTRRPLVCDGELMRLALLAEDARVLAACSIGGMEWLTSQFAFPAAAAWGRRAIEILDDAGLASPIGLLRRTGEACQTTGDTDAAIGLFDHAMTLLQTSGTDVEPFERGSLRLAQARLLKSRGELDEALRFYEEVYSLERDRGQEINAAVVRGEIADVLEARGDFDEALGIRREEELPVYERLGEVRAKAVTMGKIADVLFARGDLDEALRIRREEELPVYQRLGDVRATAVTMGKIADVLQVRGDLDEALRIRREEELPAFDRLGEVLAKAVAYRKVADILEARGEFDEALRLLREECLPAVERLGAVRDVAVFQGRIADVLFARGDLDEALRMYREVAQVFEQLGDVRHKAVAAGQIANVLQVRGDVDEALRIRREEELPVYERLGRRDLVVGRGMLAITLLSRNRARDREEARTLLCLALADARRMQLPEAAQIEAILQQTGLSCD